MFIFGTDGLVMPFLIIHTYHSHSTFIPRISIMSKRKADELSSVDIDITSLPDGVLSHISGYLEHSSRPLFAVAMTAPPSSFRLYKCNVLPQSSMREAILFPRNLKKGESEQWNEIDFGGIHKVVKDAGGLTAWMEEENVSCPHYRSQSFKQMLPMDDILHAALVCIGVSRIKVLELTQCKAVTGVGLEPLRGSKIIEKIDLSGVKAWAASKRTKRSGFTLSTSKSILSATVVIPILDSIVEEDENSLRLIHFPNHWRVEGGDDAFHGFLTKFNNNIRGKSVCGRERCNNACGGEMHTSGDRYGIQSNTCAKIHCGVSFCGCPKEDRYDEEQPLEFCHECKKYYCNACDAGLFNRREYMCGCNKPTSCGSCTDSAYCDCCGDGPICSDCFIQCKCGQTYCRMEEACK